MKIRSYLRYQFSRFILRWRWLLPILTGLVLGHWANNMIHALLPYESVLPGNALEAFIWAFGQPEIVYFVISILWIFLIADISSNPAYTQQIVLRLANRKAWWLGKILFIVSSTLLYAFILIGSFFIPVLPNYPISNTWSPAGLADHGMYIGYATSNGTPLGAFWNILIFLLIGWLAIGLLMLVIQELTRRTWPGFLSSVILIVCSQLGSISGGPVGGDGWESFFMLQNHLEFTPMWVPVRLLPQIYSWIFWGIWILICLVGSYFISQRHNFFVKNREEN